MIAELTEIRIPDFEHRPDGNASSAELDHGYSTAAASEHGIPPGEELKDPPQAENKTEVNESPKQADTVETQRPPEPVARAAGAVAAKAASGEKRQQSPSAAPEQQVKIADTPRVEPAKEAEHKEPAVAVPATEAKTATETPDTTETRASGSGDVPSGTSDERTANGGHAERRNETPREDAPDGGQPPAPPDVPLAGGEQPPDDRDRLMAEHAAAYARFAPQVDEVRYAYQTDPDSLNRPDFIAQSGSGEWPKSAVFELIDPLDGKQCVVGLHPDTPEDLSDDAMRYEALLRGAGMGPEYRDVVEQPVAYSSETHTPVRERIQGEQIGSLTTEEKAAITPATLEDGLTTLEAMAANGISPDEGGHEENTLFSFETGRLGFVDYEPIESGGYADASPQLNVGGTFLRTLDALGTPTPAEVGNIEAWRVGAHIYENGVRILHERYPELERQKDQLVEPALASGDVTDQQVPEREPEQSSPELPFYQQWFQGIEPQDEQDLHRAEHTFAGFVDGALANAVARPSATELDTYETETTGKDGRRITIQVKQDEGGRVIARRVVIPWSDNPDNTAATTYEAYYTPNDPRSEYVFRDENIPGVTRADLWGPERIGEEDIDEFAYDAFPENLGANNQAVGMREVVGLTEYLRDE